MTSKINYEPSVLRNYQRRIVEQSEGQNTIVRLPTGAGKTLIADLARSTKTKKSNSVCSIQNFS